MKIPQTRSKSKPKTNFQRASSLERFEQPGKICDDYHRRWGDYNRVIKKRESEQMQWYPVCYEIFDAQRSPEHRKSEVEKYSYEKTQHFYDNRPQKNFLTTLNHTSDYRQVTAVKISKSKDAVKEKTSEPCLRYVDASFAKNRVFKQRLSTYQSVSKDKAPKTRKDCSHISIPFRKSFKLPLNPNTPVKSKKYTDLAEKSGHSRKSRSPMKMLSPMLTGVPLRLSRPDASSLKSSMKFGSNTPTKTQGAQISPNKSSIFSPRDDRSRSRSIRIKP